MGFLEAGVVIAFDGSPIYWHLPENRTGGSLPDSHTLWEVLWNNRDIVAGFAHTHPGSGMPGPSWEDITTFAAIESGLGRRLDWWILSSNEQALVWKQGPKKHDYKVGRAAHESRWMEELRDHSLSNVEPIGTGCLECGAETVERIEEKQEFRYGGTEHGVTLDVVVPVYSCTACDFSYTGWEAEEIRHERVCLLLGVCSPKELRTLRQRHKLSISDVAIIVNREEYNVMSWGTGSRLPSLEASDALRRIGQND